VIAQPRLLNDPLQNALEIQEDAARVGFDWPDIAPVFDKILEELDEVREALAHGEPGDARRELGDLLFAVVNLARFLNTDPSRELESTNQRFLARFGKVKDTLEQAGRRIEDCSLEEMDQAWQRVKDAERRAE
jgi:ATP diphosphatase